MTYDQLYKICYEAAMEAIAMTGDAYKKLSWFARNKPGFQDAKLKADAAKKAA